MIIKKQEFKVCKECGDKKLVKDEEYGCDVCKTNIDYLSGGDDREFLEIQVFYDEDDRVSRFQLCSWACVFEKLKTVKTDYFISLPYLMFDSNIKSLGVEGFWAAIKNESINTTK